MKTLKINFYQVDMSSEGISTCSACDTVQQKLKNAIDSIKPYLSSLNTEIEQNTITIYSENDAEKHKVYASPTIRVGTFDYYPEHENLSENRIWRWKGETYPEPTEKIFSEVILRGYLGDIQQETPAKISPYLMQFLNRKPISEPAASCC
jgi:hypothetical protein